MLICEWCGKNLQVNNLDFDEYGKPKYCPECGHSQFSFEYDEPSRGDRRKKSWRKAIRKRNIYKDYYNNLHQYSKNKIHCSCPLCACKTKGKLAKRLSGPAENWKMQDIKRIEEMKDQVDEFQTISQD